MSKPINHKNKKNIKDLKLDILLEITKSINSNASTETLLGKFKEFMTNELMISKLLLYSYNNRWEIILNFGMDEEKTDKEINIETDLKPVKEITTLQNSTNEHFNNFEVIIPVFHKTEPLSYLLIGKSKKSANLKTSVSRHLPFIQTLTNIIIVAIENKKLARQRFIQEVTKKELALASQMQAMLFPDDLPNNEKLEISAIYKPLHEVGGDYYDFIRINEYEVFICMADVSGKGVSAALLMSNFQANLHALTGSKTSLIDTIKVLNKKVNLSAKGEKFITLFIAKYNQKTKLLSYINAGHNPPLLMSGDKVNILKTGCAGLGMFEEIGTILQGEVTVSPNSILLCYTDGITEIENEKEQEYGLSRLKKVLKINRQEKMEKLNSEIMKGIEQFKGLKPFVDDIALLSCRLN